MMTNDALASRVLDHIDVDELVKVALDLGNIDSPTESEGPVGEYVHDWLRSHGFAVKKLALFGDRPNIVAIIARPEVTGPGRRASGDPSDAKWLFERRLSRRNFRRSKRSKR